MQKTNNRTFQEIYDFCKLDRTYNEYYNIPDDFSCKSREQYRYYHASISPRGVSRAGTFIYCQSRKQLERFINNQQQDFYFHINKDYEEVDYQKFEGVTIYIVAHIRNDGVHIQYTHPYKSRYENDRVYFIPRSHNRFDKQGLIKEVQNHFNKKMLYPPGRYRKLQIQYRIPKERFANWYRRDYKWQQERIYEQEYWDMWNAYNPDTSISFEESFELLNASGMFFDFGVDSDCEREELAVEFMNMCNK